VFRRKRWNRCDGGVAPAHLAARSIHAHSAHRAIPRHTATTRGPRIGLHREQTSRRWQRSP
jgi:hypothetical protein